MTPVEELFQLLWDTPQDKLTWFAIKNRMLDKEKIYISEVYHKAFINATKGIEEEFQELSQRTDYWVHYDGREDYFEKTFNAKEK